MSERFNTDLPFRFSFTETEQGLKDVELTEYLDKLSIQIDEMFKRLWSRLKEGKTKYIWLPAGAFRAGGAAPAVEELNDNGFIVLTFADGADKWAQGNLMVPKDMDFTQPSYLCLGWSSPATTKVAVWDVVCLVTEVGESTEQAGTTTSAIPTTSAAAANGLVRSSVVTFAANTLDEDDVCLHIQVMRDGNHGSDTLSEIAEVHGLAFLYTALA